MENKRPKTAVETEVKTKAEAAAEKTAPVKSAATESKAKTKAKTINLNKPIEVDHEKSTIIGQVDTRGKMAKFLNLRKKESKELPPDIKKYRKWAWTGYILFFIPLLIDRKNDFMRLHANEGLDTNIIDVIAALLLILGTQLTAFSLFWKSILMSMIFMGTGLLFMTTITKIFMIIQSARGKKKQTPWLWKTRIIKKLDKDFKTDK